MDIFEWENTVYPRLWHKAYDAGVFARNSGVPRICNLVDEELCHNGEPLRVCGSKFGNRGGMDGKFPLLLEKWKRI